MQPGELRHRYRQAALAENPSSHNMPPKLVDRSITLFGDRSKVSGRDPAGNRAGRSKAGVKHSYRPTYRRSLSPRCGAGEEQETNKQNEKYV